MDKTVSRKEKRKAARQEKKQLKHHSLIHHQKLRKLKTKDDPKVGGKRNGRAKEGVLSLRESDSDSDEALRVGTLVKGGRSDISRLVSMRNGSELSSDSEGDVPIVDRAIAEKKLRKDNNNNKKVSGKKTKFEEFLELEGKGGPSMDDDLEMERRLAKKLKVNNGKLRDDDDGLNSLFDGILSDFDSSRQDYHGESDSESEHVEHVFDKKSKKKKKSKRLPESDTGNDDSDIEEAMESMIFESDETGEPTISLDGEAPNVEGSGIKKSKKSKRRKKEDCENGTEIDNGSSDVGQENNISVESGGEANNAIEKNSAFPNGAPGSSKYVAPHLRSQSGDDLQKFLQIRRRIRGLLNRMSESNVESITGEIFSILQTVTRAIASQMINEEVLASCIGGPRGNEQYAGVFAAFVAGISSMVGIEFSAKFMASLAKSFEDEYSKEDNLSLRNVSLLLSYLCIFGVCSSDLIYDFLLKLSKRLTEVDVSTILTILHCCGMKLRGDDPATMKDFIISVQGRVKEMKAGSESVEATKYNKRMEFMLETICDIKNNKKRAREDSPQHTRIKKWLQKLRVETVSIRGIKWSKLLDPEKKGQWWFSGDVSSVAEDLGKTAGNMNRDVHEAQKMLQLAAKQRMNTDTRKSIFCVIMSAEDYIDAFEQLLNLNLQGKQDREIMRVLVECCLQEKVFNKYYTALASKLCSHDKNHKFSLQYCLWDQFKEVESMPLVRSMHLAKFVAEMLAGFSLSLAVLKVVDLIDATQLTAKRIMHFKMLFESIFEHPDNVVWNMFTRVAVTPELEDLRNGMEFFIREYVVTSNKDVSKRFKLAKKALNNAEGVLM